MCLRWVASSLRLLLPSLPSAQLRVKQDEERKKLLTVRESLKEKMGIGAKSATGHARIDLQSNPDFTDKSGYLGKRAEALRIPRRAWPKRYCTVSMNGFTMASSHVSLCAVVSLPVSLPSTTDTQPHRESATDALSVQRQPRANRWQKVLFQAHCS